MRRFVHLLLPLSLLGCAALPAPPEPLEAALRTGDRLVITRAAAQAPVNGTVVFQRGEPRGWYVPSVWETRCRLHLAAGEGGRLGPGEHVVTGAQHRSIPVSEGYAAVSTRITLRTVLGTPLEYLECERWMETSGGAAEAARITLEDLHAAVGGYVEILSAVR